MKSKRAEDKMCKSSTNAYKMALESVLRESDAREAIELAEEDARDRARKAFCAMCSIPECTGEWSEDFYTTGCQNAPAQFLKYYDNE